MRVARAIGAGLIGGGIGSVIGVILLLIFAAISDGSCSLRWMSDNMFGSGDSFVAIFIVGSAIGLLVLSPYVFVRAKRAFSRRSAAIVSVSVPLVMATLFFATGARHGVYPPVAVVDFTSMVAGLVVGLVLAMKLMGSASDRKSAASFRDYH